jgi:hypothetical protein
MSYVHSSLPWIVSHISRFLKHTFVIKLLKFQFMGDSTSPNNNNHVADGFNQIVLSLANARCARSSSIENI